jgi:DNA-directed RNA polymerase specialized sigma subunit
MDDHIKVFDKEDGRTQQEMMAKLLELEKKFKKVLLSNDKGRDVYIKFMKFILEDKGNILSSRVYFRERQDVFASKLAMAFHKKTPDMLHKFRINFLFCQWAIKAYSGKPRKDLQNLLNDMKKQRSQICEMSLPSAIHKAKVFWSKIPGSHLEYMDIVQNASEGLLIAIDKYDGEFYHKKFGSSVNTRMTERILTDHNSTMISMSGTDKRILYRANRANIEKKNNDNINIADYVKESFSNTSEGSINEIVSAANGILSIDKPMTEDDTKTIAEIIPDTQESQEDSTINNQLTLKLYVGIKLLTVLEGKIIMLKTGIYNPI